MTIDEVVQFFQSNASALMMFAYPQFKDVHLNQMRIHPFYNQKIHGFCDDFFKLIDNINPSSIQPIIEIVPSSINPSLTNREAFLFVLAYSLHDAEDYYEAEQDKIKQALKKIAEENQPLVAYLEKNITSIKGFLLIFNSAIREHTSKLVPWLSDNSDFLRASISPSFSSFVDTLPQDYRDRVINYSNNMKQLFAQPYLRQSKIDLTSIESGSIFDPLSYYLTRIIMLSDLNSNEIAQNDLNTFFSVNPQLRCFMALETEKLDPIVDLWRATKLSDSTSRITSILTSTTPNVPSAISSQSTSRLAVSDDEADDFREHILGDKKRKSSGPVVSDNDDDDGEHLSSNAFPDSLDAKKARKDSSEGNSEGADSSSLISAIPVNN